ncbi:MAG: hypothetical protein RI953_661 [Pseudomonadota bacterium]|jgi:hypothetical protein
MRRGGIPTPLQKKKELQPAAPSFFGEIENSSLLGMSNEKIETAQGSESSQVDSIVL